MYSSWRGELGFWPNSFEGVLGLSDNLGGPLFRVLLNFYVTIFQSLTSPHRCAYMVSYVCFTSSVQLLVKQQTVGKRLCFYLDESQLSQLGDAVVGGLALKEELAPSHRLWAKKAGHCRTTILLKNKKIKILKTLPNQDFTEI